MKTWISKDELMADDNWVKHWENRNKPSYAQTPPWRRDKHLRIELEANKVPKNNFDGWDD